MNVIEAVFITVLAILAIPVLLFFSQIFVSLLPSRMSPRPTYLDQKHLASIAVLIPAHNERQGIGATLESIKSQLNLNDRIIVVADHCDDETAEIAKSFGATVIERSNQIKRGKSYALDYGVRYLENNSPPDVVIIIDADCLLGENCLHLLTNLAMSKNKPIQSADIMLSPVGAGVKTKVAEFAWIVKNWARALGYYKIGLPCQLMGSGMAFPWLLIQQANLASGHIVEDLKLGLDFADKKLAPVFCPAALVTSKFPLNKDGANTQRVRWEHGHLDMMVKEGPKLLFRSMATLNLPMLALVLDMFIPPLALLTLFVIVLVVVAGIMMMVTQLFMPWFWAVILLLLLSISILMAWVKFGQSIITLSHLAYAPIYMLSKIPLYFRFFIKRQVEWVRSKRDNI